MHQQSTIIAYLKAHESENPGGALLNDKVIVFGIKYNYPFQKRQNGDLTKGEIEKNRQNGPIVISQMPFKNLKKKIWKATPIHLFRILWSNA